MLVWAVDMKLPVRMANQISHRSHTLEVCRGLVHCTKCGYYGAFHLRKLAEPYAPITSYGRRSLYQIEVGRLPDKFKDWPERTIYVFNLWFPARHRHHAKHTTASQWIGLSKPPGTACMQQAIFWDVTVTASDREPRRSWFGSVLWWFRLSTKVIMGGIFGTAPISVRAILGDWL